MFKKAFTLIELSIVLLVLAILVASILIGRSIITRARVQRIYDDIQNIRLATATFRDTYGAWPGNLNTTNCSPYSVFNTTSSVACLVSASGGIIDDASMSFNLININAKNMYWPNRFLVASGTLSNMKNQSLVADLTLTGTIAGLVGSNTQTLFQNYSLYASYDNNIYYNVFSFKNVSDSSSGCYLSRDIITGLYSGGACTAGGINNTEFTPTVGNGNYANASALSSMIAKYNFIAITSNGTSAGTNGAGNVAAFSIETTSALDIKFDDGLPYTGLIIALKPAISANGDKYCTISTIIPGAAAVTNNSVEGLNKYASANSTVAVDTTTTSSGCNIIVAIETDKSI